MIASSSPKRRLAGLAVTSLAASGLAALLVTALVDPAAAKNNREREPKRDESVLSRAAGQPLLAIVSLGEQRVTIYDAEGRILRAPVSTGQTGYETPAGIYSVIQKEAEHYSNLYDDASMPFMQRITWSGIALHAGALPGYPASHGCIRMPHGFAERLFELTAMGLRVIVVPNDVTPGEIVHPVLFKPRPLGAEVSLANPPASRPGQDQPMRLGAGSDDNVPPPTIPPRRLETLKSIAAAKAAEVEAASPKGRGGEVGCFQDRHRIGAPGQGPAAGGGRQAARRGPVEERRGGACRRQRQHQPHPQPDRNRARPGGQDQGGGQDRGSPGAAGRRQGGSRAEG